MIIGIYLAPVPALLVESFPTSIRFTGMALSYNICAIVGGLTPAVSTWLISTTGNNDSIMFVLVGSAVASLLGLMVYKDRWQEPLTSMR
jgi:MHS family proline/betaine transporter-like MFS transporter